MLWLAAVLVLLPLAGLIYQYLGERRDGRRYRAPGRMAAGFHVYQTGSAGPPVLLEAGIAASSISWRLVQEPLSELARVASYDRAGFGWSPARKTPRTLPNLVEELHSVLLASGLTGPVVLLGHSFGGLVVRHYAARYPETVAGLVLLDPLEPFEWHPLSEHQSFRLKRGVLLARRGATLARFGVVRLALDLLLAGSLLLPQLMAKVSSGKGSAVTDRLVGELRKLPSDLWPVMRAHWSLARSFRTIAEYLATIPDACARPLDESALGGIPCTVISAGKSSPEVIAAHKRTAEVSRLGRHIIAGGSGHWVQLDAPEVVVEAVRRLALESSLH